MKKFIALVIISTFLLFPLLMSAQNSRRQSTLKLQSPEDTKIGFVIHGGAGVIRRGSLTPQKEAEYRAKLEEAVLAGYNALKAGKNSLDAIEAAIIIMEDSPLFNAGKGAVFTADGKNELDASVMDGKTQNAGAVAGLRKVRNPIKLARAVMEKSEHVMMIGDGAEKFAVDLGITMVSEKYFWTQRRWDSLQNIIKSEAEKSKAKAVGVTFSKPDPRELPENRFGTVGAVALDKKGNLAAGTSTGGMTYKKYGRVGDVPVIGAGTYANNATCAVSATGWGEFFIRLSVAKDISSMMEYKNLSVQEAADAVIHGKLQNLGGDGGVVAIDKKGNIGISFNSEGMYRAYVDEKGKAVVEIYGK